MDQYYFHQGNNQSLLNLLIILLSFFLKLLDEYTIVNVTILILNREFNVYFYSHLFQHIEEVTGYILITRISANHIDFSSLRLIRGNTLYQDPPISCEGSTYAALRNSQPNFMRANRTGYALYVVDNTRSFIGGGFKELWMPNLAGNCKTIFYENDLKIKSSLCSWYYTKAFNEWWRPFPSFSVWATQHRKNVIVAVATLYSI